MIHYAAPSFWKRYEALRRPTVMTFRCRDVASALTLLVSSTPGHSAAQSTYPRGCYILGLGPSVSTERPPIRAPQIIQLLPSGEIRAAATLEDTLVRPALGQWRAIQDSLLIGWTPGRLSGSLELFVMRQGDTLRGRYAMHHHEVDDGRLLWRGEVMALHSPCPRAHVTDSTAHLNARAVAAWRVRQVPDTALAVAEALRAFEASLLAVPIHTLSLFNYRIATYACRHGGRLPVALSDLRDTVLISSSVGILEERSFRDAWNRPLRFEPHPPGYHLRSAGPDGSFDTPDDLISDMAAPLRRDPELNCLSRFW